VVRRCPRHPGRRRGAQRPPVRPRSHGARARRLTSFRSPGETLSSTNRGARPPRRAGPDGWGCSTGAGHHN
jgi:hypothetical protein